MPWWQGILQTIIEPTHVLEAPENAPIDLRDGVVESDGTPVPLGAIPRPVQATRTYIPPLSTRPDETGRGLPSEVPILTITGGRDEINVSNYPADMSPALRDYYDRRPGLYEATLPTTIVDRGLEPDIIITDSEDGDVSIIEDLWNQVDDTVFGGWLPGGAPVGGNPTAPAAGQVVATEDGGAVVVNAPTGAPPMPTYTGPKPVLKYHCGAYKWVFPKRRRRRRLASQSDIKDLSALKGVLGGGKAFELWIATHS